MKGLNNGKRDIICFGEDWYSPSFGVTKQVMRLFKNEGHRVFWVNPIPYRVPAITSKTFKKRFIYKLKSHMKVFKKADANQITICPIYLPFLGSDVAGTINKKLLSIQIDIIKKVFDITDCLYWGTCGYTINYILDKIKNNLFIYNFCDKFSSHRGISKKIKEELEKKDVEIISKANIILCSSEKIFQYVKGKTEEKEKAIYFPHGVDLEHFIKTNERDMTVPIEMSNIKHPVIGYFGSLGDGFDEEIVAFCAEKRPEYSFVLIGSPGGKCEELRQMKNVYLLGPKEYQEIPQYGSCFDVCMMNWRPHEWLDYCFPIKTLEYLAMGKPVVSNPIYEILYHFNDVVSVAEGKVEFLEKIENELLNDSEEKRHARIKKVQRLTWRCRLDSLKEILGKKLL